MNDTLKVKDPHKPSGKVKVGKYWVTVDRDLCIGAATCMAVAEKTFALDGDAKAVILESADKEKSELLIEAAKDCPVLAIIIENEKGERVFPK